MKKLYSILALVLLASKAMADQPLPLPSPHDEPVPKLNQAAEIDINTPSGWNLRVHPDGSAQLGYGSSGGDSAIAPKASISYSRVYDRLVPHLNKSGNIRDDFAVTIFRTGENSAVALYSDDKATIKQIMSEALEKVFPFWEARFKELLTKYPLIPN